MKNEKAKNVLIVVLIILVLACVGYIAYPYVVKSIEKADKNTNKQEQSNVLDKSTNDYEAIYAEVKEKYNDIEFQRGTKVYVVGGEFTIKDQKVYLYDHTTKIETIISGINGVPKYICGFPERRTDLGYRYNY